MILTDTHTHLYYETDPEKREALIKRCLENNVSRLFLPNVDSASISLVMGLVQDFPQYCFPMLGLHPCDVKEDFQEELNSISDAIQKYKIYAIGEIGIDLYWDKSTLNFQQTAFRKQIAWAKTLNIPIVIHCREAFDEVYRILVEEKDKKLRGIFHCFTGTLEQARLITDLNFYLGIGGVITYKNSGLAQVVQQMDLNHIVLETDSPYLAPVPHRGKSNESSYLPYIAQKVADIFNITMGEVARITTENSKKIFSI